MFAMLLCLAITVSTTSSVLASELPTVRFEGLPDGMSVRTYQVSEDKTISYFEMEGGFARFAWPGVLQVTTQRLQNGNLLVNLHNLSIFSITVSGNVTVHGDTAPFNPIVSHTIVSNVIGVLGTIRYTIHVPGGSFGGGTMTFTVTPPNGPPVTATGWF